MAQIHCECLVPLKGNSVSVDPDVKRILVSRLRFMGDLILTTPLVCVLRTAFPSAEIVYLAEKPYIDLLRHHPCVDRLIPLPKTVTGQAGCIGQLIGNHYDIAIDLFGNPRSALLTWISGAKIRIGGNFRGRRLLYTARVHAPLTTLNAIQFHLRYLEPLGLSSSVRVPSIRVTRDEKLWAQNYLSQNGYSSEIPIVGLHIGATWPAKKWLPERFSALAREIREKLNTQVFFTAGPDEIDSVTSVIAQSKIKANEPEVLPLRSLAAVLSCFTLFVSNDCGPMHLGPAVGTRTIGLFGPGEPEIWFPYTDEQGGHRFIHKQIDCSRCHRDLCEKKTCMEKITVADVFESVKECLGKNS